MRTSLGVAALLLAAAVPASAQREEGLPKWAQEVTDRFRLFTECKPIGLVVGVKILHNDRITLTKAKVTQAVRSRLRAARIYSDMTSSPRQVMDVDIAIVEAAFSIRVELLRWLWDGPDGGFASTWQTGGVGTHADDSGFVLGGLSEYMDEFIDEYLRVNAAACG